MSQVEDNPEHQVVGRIYSWSAWIISVFVCIGSKLMIHFDKEKIRPLEAVGLVFGSLFIVLTVSLFNYWISGSQIWLIFSSSSMFLMFLSGIAADIVQE